MRRRQKPFTIFYSRDQKYRRFIVQKIRTRIMKGGKKSKSSSITYQFMTEIGATMIPIHALEQRVRNIRPRLIITSRRLGGTTYQIPVRLESNKRTNLGIRWLLSAARSRTGITIRQRIRQEVSECLRGNGGAMRKRDEISRIAESNQAFIRTLYKKKEKGM